MLILYVDMIEPSMIALHTKKGIEEYGRIIGTRSVLVRKVNQVMIS